MFQRKWPEAVGCAQAIVRVVGQGLAQLVGGKKLDDMTEQAAELRARLPGQVDLADSLQRFAAELPALEDSADGHGLAELFASIDRWMFDVAEVATMHDPQLDLRDALPKVPRVATSPSPVAASV